MLDLACGTGAVARLAAPQVGPAGHVVGLDLNPGMLAQARAVPARAGASIEWQEGNAGELPFDTGSFDAVLCQLGLQYFPDRQKAAGEMYRVLKPTGRVVTLVWRALEHSPGFAALAAAAVMRAPFVFGDGIQELRELLSHAGFKKVRISADVRMVRFTSVAALVQYQVAGSPLAAHVAAVDDQAREALVRDVSAALQRYANDDGLAFPIEGHIAVAQP